MKNPFSGDDSRFSQDLFQQWKAEQNADIAARGADSDPAVEEEHNNYMLRQNMNAYVCYKELDEYTTCLTEKNLISSNEDGGGYEVDVRNHVNGRLCRSTHRRYVSCMSSQRNQSALLGNATIHPNCAHPRKALFECMEEHQVVEARTQVPQCEGPYRRMLRCGLNHLWNDYWRALTRVGEAEEYHLFELSRDERKKQEYLRVITTGEEELRRQRADQRDREQGYYLDPERHRRQQGQGEAAS